jgi:hypothetical protein
MPTTTPRSLRQSPYSAASFCSIAALCHLWARFEPRTFLTSASEERGTEAPLSWRQSLTLPPMPSRTASHLPDNLLTKFQAQSGESIAKPGGQRMWLDLLVASGLGLPAMIYGSVLFLNYMQ